MKIIGVIPARLGSTRLEAKVLRDLNGKPMIQHVWERTQRAEKLSDVIVACDDEKILNCVEAFGGKAVMTRKDHPNGSSRIAEVLEKEDCDAAINVQGDEPLIDPANIDLLAQAFLDDSGCEVATLAVRRSDRESWLDPNVVKVVCSRSGNALYFSRAPIPFLRDEQQREVSFLKHVGIYGYRKDFLLRFVSWPMGVLEQTEKLEQLRILEQGCSIRVIETENDSLSVDTEEDARRVESILKKTI